MTGSSVTLGWQQRFGVLALALATFVVGFWALATSALAAQGAAADCSQRYSTGIQMQINGIWYGVPCSGATQYASSSNGVKYIRDVSGPICIYYGSTLAGCAGKANSLYVGNRIGYIAVVKTRPLAI